MHRHPQVRDRLGRWPWDWPSLCYVEGGVKRVQSVDVRGRHAQCAGEDLARHSRYGLHDPNLRRVTRVCVACCGYTGLYNLNIGIGSAYSMRRGGDYR
jgi:hypothetical protein